MRLDRFAALERSEKTITKLNALKDVDLPSMTGSFETCFRKISRLKS